MTTAYGDSFKFVYKAPLLPWTVMMTGMMSLQVMQAAVGGPIERFMVPELIGLGVELFVNEEGLMRGAFPNIGYKGTTLVGPLLFCAFTPEGDTVSMTDEQIAATEAWLMEVGHAQELSSD